MDKLNEVISIKISTRLKLEIEDKALDEGIEVSLLCRKWLIQKLHESKFRMKDYLKTLDEDQGK
jgi:hypothetical protein